MPTVRYELVGVGAELARLGGALDAAMAGVVLRACDLAADAAKRDHPYTDRSRTLTESIEAGQVTGGFMAGTLAGTVVAGADYAEYVDGKPRYAFLEPAYRTIEHRVDEDAHTALEQAARDAGW